MKIRQTSKSQHPNSREDPRTKLQPVPRLDWKLNVGGVNRCRLYGFTLIELILVMTVLTITVSIIAPQLANFFRGRTLGAEARRMLALIRQGQSRAVGEGLPMELWLDAQQGSYGLEAEPSYEAQDSKAVSFTLDRDMQLELVNLASETSTPTNAVLTSSVSARRSNHPNLPAIRFLPDGSFGESSPRSLRLTGRDGRSTWLALSRNGLNYEIRSRSN